MKRYNPLYYLLFVLLIMGSFASMAQNDYGFKILGGVAISFAILFAVQFSLHFTRKGYDNTLGAIESLSLVFLSVVLACRVYFIRFQFVEIVFGIAGIALIIVYILKLRDAYTDLRLKNNTIALLVAAFYGSIVLYAVSMTIVPFVPQLAEPAGGLAFGLLLLFVGVGFIKRDTLIDGEKVSAFSYVARFKDRSIVLLSLFLLFTAYMGLTKIDALPRMYSDKFPQAYFELVHQAEAGVEKPVDGKFKHEEFKEKYDRFVNRHARSGNK